MPAEKLLFSFSSAGAVFFHPLPAVLLPAPMHGLLSLLCGILSFSIAIVLSALHHDLPSLVSLSSLQGGCFLCGEHRFLPLLFASCHLPALSPPFCGGSLLRAVCRFCAPLRIRLGDFLNSYESQNCFCLNLQLPLSCAFAPSPAAPPSPGHLHPVLPPAPSPCLLPLVLPLAFPCVLFASSAFLFLAAFLSMSCTVHSAPRL